MFSEMQIANSISEIDGWVAESAKSGEVTFGYPLDKEHYLLGRMDLAMKPVFVTSRSACASVLDAVRNRVLDWSMDLEGRGILGYGMTFSAAEQRQAQQVQTMNVTNTFHGNVSHSQVGAAAGNVTQSMSSTQLAPEIGRLADGLNAAIDQLGLAASTRAELAAEIATLRAQSASPRPKVDIVRETLRSVRIILEGAGGNVVAAHFPQLALMTASLLERLQ